MFILLLALSVFASLLVCAVTILLFWWPLRTVLASRVSESAALLWNRLLAFAVCVIGVSFGVRLWDLEPYAQAGDKLSANQLLLETYKSLIFTAQANVIVLAFIFLGIGIVAMMKRPDAPPGMSSGKP